MTTYEVEKFARGGDGKWFGMGARRFDSIDVAREYFERFAAAQLDVLDNGIRIDLRERRGRRLIATVGGLLDIERARAIRWLDAEVRQ